MTDAPPPVRLADLPELRFVDAARDVRSLRPADHAEEIAARAALLRAQFVPGTAIGIAIRTEPRLVLAWLAAIAAGLRPLILQYPTTKQTRDYWRSSVLHTIDLVDMAGIIGDARVAAMLEGEAITLVDADALAPGAHVPVDGLPRFEILQLSSGTTGHRKAIAFTDAQLWRHAHDYNGALGLDAARDRIVSWLPLYHDMGYIACFVMPLLLGVPVTMIDPETWVADKTLLFEVIARDRGTICYMPNFGFETLAQPTAHDLSSMRRWISCSEPVFGATVRRFLAATGVPADRFAACYAMAENVFAVSLSEGFAEREIDGTVIASCGAPIPGVDVKLVDGEILARSPASIAHYVGGDDIRDAEGFYPTGDTGALVDGQLYVTGRRRDVLIQAGRKYLLSSIDAAVGEVLPDVKGRAATVILRDARLGTEKPAVLIEARDFFDRTDHATVAAAVQARTGLDFLDIAFVPPRFLTKTSSGKINRVASARDWQAREEMRAVGARDAVAEFDRVFAALPADLPVEALDSLSQTLLRIILSDAGCDHEPAATLADHRHRLAATAPATEPALRPLRIVSLADRRSIRRVTEAHLQAFAERLGVAVSFEHICLPPSPILLSDLVFLDYFRPRLGETDACDALARIAARLRGADVILTDDVAEMHFPMTQVYPVLSHRLERTADADLLAFRWQRYVESHHRLPVMVVNGDTLPIAGRTDSIAALSRYLAVPIFRIAGIEPFASFTTEWEYRPLRSESGGPGLRPLDGTALFSRLAGFIEEKRAAGMITVPAAAPAVVRFDLTDLAHFCSQAASRAAIDHVVAMFDRFCIVGQPASIPYVRAAITARGKTFIESPGYHSETLAQLPAFDCLLSCGATGAYDGTAPAAALMAAGWQGYTSNLPAERFPSFEVGLPSAPRAEWYCLSPEGPALSGEDLARVEEGNAAAASRRSERRAEARGAQGGDPMEAPVPLHIQQRQEARRAARRAARREA